MRHFHLAALGVRGVIAILVAVGTIACAATSPKATPTPGPEPTATIPSRIPPGGGALGTKSGVVFKLKGNSIEWPGIEGEANIEYEVKVVDLKPAEVVFDATLATFNGQGGQLSNDTRTTSLSPLNIWSNSPVVTLDWNTHRERWEKGIEQMKISSGTTEAQGEVYERAEKLGDKDLNVVFFFARQKVKDDDAKTDLLMERTYGYSKELGILVRQGLTAKGTFEGQQRDSLLELRLDKYSEP